MKRFQKKDIFTIPNIMGYCRILLIPVFCYFYIFSRTLPLSLLLYCSKMYIYFTFYGIFQRSNIWLLQASS